MNIRGKKKGFTLIELLVVVSIIGILVSIGIVTYNGYTLSAKRATTLQNYKMATRFINNTFGLCSVLQEKITISSGNIIDCNAINNISNVTKIGDTFKNHFIKIGFKNPYDNNAPAIIRTGSGGDKVDGRLRLDETDCRSSGGKGGYKKLVLWVKTHKDHENKTFLIDGWQKWCDK
jgi:prepilin-type N-terminal cleavage/methylation domain-containing protein